MAANVFDVFRGRPELDGSATSIAPPAENPEHWGMETGESTFSGCF
jgi:hypothetical protein